MKRLIKRIGVGVGIIGIGAVALTGMSRVDSIARFFYEIVPIAKQDVFELDRGEDPAIEYGQLIKYDNGWATLTEVAKKYDGAIASFDNVTSRNGWESLEGCDWEVNDHLGKNDQLNAVHCTITHDMIEASKGNRGQFDEDPSGWPEHNVKVKSPAGKDIWLWNRSHLVADQLGGEATPRNAVPGTRFQNVGSGSGGMRLPETRAVTLLDEHPDCPVRYDVTPVYANTSIDAIPIVVEVDIETCDSAYKAHFTVINGQPGYAINLVNGEVREEE